MAYIKKVIFLSLYQVKNNSKLFNNVQCSGIILPAELVGKGVFLVSI